MLYYSVSCVMGVCVVQCVLCVLQCALCDGCVVCVWPICGVCTYGICGMRVSCVHGVWYVFMCVYGGPVVTLALAQH